MAKRFRRVFVVCEDNQIFTNMQHVPVYKYRENAEFACKKLEQQAKAEQKKLWNANRPLPKFKMNGFFMVHEEMFRD